MSDYQPVHAGGWGGGSGKEPLYLIWSEEHGAWWRGTWGYTHFMTEATRFTKTVADKIVEQGNLVIHPESGFLATRKFNEIAIPDPL